MIDYLLRFDDEAQAIQLCPDMRAGTEEHPRWNTTFVIPDVKAFMPAIVEGEPDTYLPGFYLWLCADAREPALEDFPWCLLGADRGTGVVVHARLPLEALSTTFITPVIAGSQYRFGEPKTVGVDVLEGAIKV